MTGVTKDVSVNREPFRKPKPKQINSMKDMVLRERLREREKVGSFTLNLLEICHILDM